MNQKSVAIAAVLAAALLAGIFSTTTMAVYGEEDYGDSSETETNQKNKQGGAASGHGDVHNCAENNIESVRGSIGTLSPTCSDVAGFEAP